ncbi:MAG TPA: PilZ domain-containing protein [Terriglobales bacterium]|nr:PilZ domain-containing protein [Terriglobales bacterium]
MSQSLEKSAADRIERRVSVALPVRVTYYDEDSRPRLEMACTYDISAHGARLTGLRCAKDAGEILTIERGRSKAFCRVVWVGDTNSHLQGQVGIQCVEAEKALWIAELRDMEQVYETMKPEGRAGSTAPGNRRRHQRFHFGGSVELLQKGAGSTHLEGCLKDVSEVGCLVTTKSLVLPGTDLKLVLRFANYDLAFHGRVRHAASDVGLGIEFREVRKGDRALLQHLLRKAQIEQKANVEDKSKFLWAGALS